MYDPSVSISNEGLATSCVSPGGLHDVVEDAAAEDEENTLDDVDETVADDEDVERVVEL